MLKSVLILNGSGWHRNFSLGFVHVRSKIGYPKIKYSKNCQFCVCLEWPTPKSSGLWSSFPRSFRAYPIFRDQLVKGDPFFFGSVGEDHGDVFQRFGFRMRK